MYCLLCLFLTIYAPCTACCICFKQNILPITACCFKQYMLPCISCCICFKQYMPLYRMLFQTIPAPLYRILYVFQTIHTPMYRLLFQIIHAPLYHLLFQIIHAPLYHLLRMLHQAPVTLFQVAWSHYIVIWVIGYHHRQPSQHCCVTRECGTGQTTLSVKVKVIFYFLLSWPAPMAHRYRLGLVTCRYQVRIPVGTDICHRCCAYTMLQTVQRPGVYSAAYGTVHYREPAKSFKIRVGQSPDFGLPTVAILPWSCRKRRKAIFTHPSFLFSDSLGY